MTRAPQPTRADWERRTSSRAGPTSKYTTTYFATRIGINHDGAGDTTGPDACPQSGTCLHHNTLSDHAWQMRTGGSGTANVYANDITDWAAWQFPTNAYHTDGLISWSAPNAIVTNYVYDNYIHGDLGHGSPTAFIYCTYGADKDGSGSTCTIFNNVLDGTSSLWALHGVAVGQNNQLGPYVLYDNTFVVGSSATAVEMYTDFSNAQPSTMTFDNNVFVADTTSYFYHQENSGTPFAKLTADHNLYFGGRPFGPWNGQQPATLAMWQAYCKCDANSVVGDPKLTAYAPSVGSPAIGLGTNLTSVGIFALDLTKAGAPRPSTGAWTAGALWRNLKRRMRVRRVFAVFAVGSIVALMAACLFPSLDALTQTSDAATDVFQTDASSDAADAKALTYTEEVLTDFPEMYLRLGESDGATIAVDTTGDNYAGDYPDAGCVLGVPGAIVNDPDTAVTFDGVHTIHVSPSFDFPNTSAFTIEVWALQTMYSDSGFTIDHEDWSDGRNGWDMLLDSTYVGGERWLEGGTHGSNTETDAGLTLGKFHHVVITFDGSAFCTYVDGAQLQCKPIAVEPIPSTGIGWAIGGNNNCGNCGSFVGTLDEFALYTHALSAARVAVHYHVGSGTP